MQGVGFADTVWETFVDGYFTGGSLSPRVRSPEVSRLVQGVSDSLMCMKLYNKVIAQPGVANILPEGPVVPSVSPDGRRKIYGRPGVAADDDLCGSVDYGTWAAIKAGVANDSLINPLSGSVSGAAGAGAGIAAGFAKGYSMLAVANPVAAAVGAIGGSAIGSNAAGFVSGVFGSSEIVRIATAHIAAIDAIEAEVGPMLDAMVAQHDSNATMSPDMVALQRAGEVYGREIGTALEGMLGGATEFADMRDQLKNGGWVMAGAWLVKAASLQDQIAKLVSSVPSVTTPKLDESGFDEKWAPQLKSAWTGYTAAVEKAGRNGMLGPRMALTSTVGNETNIFSGISNFIAEGMFKLFTPDTSRNALMAIKDYGDGLMWAGEGLMLSAIAVISGSAAAGKLGKSKLIAALLKTGSVTGMIMLGVAASLTVFGATIAIYLPLAPFLIFFGTFLGWLVLVMEAMIAAPLWSIMHLSPAGNDFMGSAKQGYMLIVSPMLRPAMVVLGFVGALVIMEPVVQFFHAIYFDVFRTSLAGSFMGIVTILVMIVLYFGFMVHLFHKGFGLIHYVPDKILKWMGGGGEMLGAYGDAAHQQGQQAVSNVLGQAVRGTAAGAAHQFAMNRITDIQTRNTTLAEIEQGAAGIVAAKGRMGNLARQLAMPGLSQQDQASILEKMNGVEEAANRGFVSMVAAAVGSNEALRSHPSFKALTDPSTPLGERSGHLAKLLDEAQSRGLETAVTGLTKAQASLGEVDEVYGLANSAAGSVVGASVQNAHHAFRDAGSAFERTSADVHDALQAYEGARGTPDEPSALKRLREAEANHSDASNQFVAASSAYAQSQLTESAASELQQPGIQQAGGVQVRRASMIFSGNQTLGRASQALSAARAFVGSPGMAGKSDVSGRLTGVRSEIEAQLASFSEPVGDPAVDAVRETYRSLLNEKLSMVDSVQELVERKSDSA